MLHRLIALVAVAFFIAACETASQTTTDSSGESSSSTAASSASTSSSSGSSGSSGSSSSSSGGSASSSSSSGITDKASAEDALAAIGNTVFFDYDSSALSADAEGTLMRQAAFLNANPALTVTLEGHCDERGTREYNLALGERRGSAARDFLLAQGVDSARIRVVSYGKERPAAAGSNESSWAKNRRAATVIN
ncbi:MAG: peptidoglycan-associated lipoprotein Pal [Pseudomonadota bacterium]|nr:peptidoglycan-associated lipoprotein Pal [Pseudomonadota bacterium]